MKVGGALPRGQESACSIRGLERLDPQRRVTRVGPGPTELERGAVQGRIDGSADLKGAGRSVAGHPRPASSDQGGDQQHGNGQPDREQTALPLFAGPRLGPRCAISAILSRS